MLLIASEKSGPLKINLPARSTTTCDPEIVTFNLSIQHLNNVPFLEPAKVKRIMHAVSGGEWILKISKSIPMDGRDRKVSD